MAELSASDNALLWKAGRLRHLLHAGQRIAYDKIMAWEKSCADARETETRIEGLYPRVFYIDSARRFGKDYMSVLMCIEKAIRRPKSVYSYGTAFQKDISSIVIPLIEKICETCPQQFKPVYRAAHQNAESGYYFPNGSIIKLIGIERNPDATLRGRFSDGIFLSEAAFIDRLDYILRSVISPMFQKRPWANVIINSTPPIDPGHEIDSLVLGDCVNRGAYHQATIYDNAMLSPYEIEDAFRDAGGKDSPTAQRELLCKRVRIADHVVIPEFDSERHVRAFDLPKYGFGYTIVDPGIRDLCGVVELVNDFERGKLLVVSDWAKSGANTIEVAGAVKRCEAEAFNGLKAWNGSKFIENPYQRFSDTDARIILDLTTQYGLKIGPVDKDGADAALHALRTAFLQDMIEVHPRCKATIAHLTNAVWNKQRTSYERSPTHGHYDLVDCLKYGWRHVSRHQNPNPPKGFSLLQAGSPDNIFYCDEHLKSKRSVVDAMNAVLPKGWRVRGRK